jgi:prophage regulatory protein
LGLPDVKQRTELSRSTIYLRIAQGPSQCAWASRAVVGWKPKLKQWLQRRIEANRSESRGVGATLEAAAIFELKNVTTYPYLSQRYDFHAPIA